MLETGKVMVALDIPPEFERDLHESRTTQIQLQVDGSDAPLAYLCSNYAGQIVGGFADEIAIRRAGVSDSELDRLPIIDTRERVWFNPNRDDKPFQAIYDLATMIVLFSMMLPATGLAREKERGTIEQLMVSPLTPMQIMLSKVLPMTTIIVAATAICLYVVIEGALGVDLRGSKVLFLALTGLSSFVMSGLGLLIAAVTRNIAQVGLISILLLPIMLMLSGSDTPPEMMPTALLPVMYASPLHHYLNIMHGILLRGAGLGLLWDSVLYMALLGTVLFGLGIFKLREQFR